MVPLLIFLQAKAFISKWYPEMSRQIYIDIILPSKFDYCLASDKTSASDGAIIHKSQDLRVESGSNFNDTFFMNNHL